MTKKFQNTFIEFHILQSFPVTCLNRDDVGSPKTAIIGGRTRARVSSQCWKRAVRMAMHDYCNVKLGMRTKKLYEIISDECIKQGAGEEQTEKCTDKIISFFADKDTLHFVSNGEAKAFAEYIKELEFDDSKIEKKEINKIAKNIKINDGLDIALFGRMVAKAPEQDIEAASCFSHAISTHEISNEIDFFTALDDFNNMEGTEDKTQGAGHLGSVEYNSATYYRYISLNLGQLFETFGEDVKTEDINSAVESFIKALYLAVPVAKQTSMSGACSWDYAKILVRNGQRLQISFETSVKRQDGGYLKSSIEELKQKLVDKEKAFGSLWEERGSYEIMDGNGVGIDDIISGIKKDIENIEQKERKNV